MIEEVNPEERGVLMQAIKPVTDGEQPAETVKAVSQSPVTDAITEPAETIQASGYIETDLPDHADQAPEIMNCLEYIYNKPLPPRPNIGVESDGFKDDDALEAVKDKAWKTIRENITKLYKTKVKKVAIVGTAMTHKDAPYSDPSWEIWGLNDHWNNMPRATRWFEVNYEACKIAKVSHQPDMTRMDWLKKCPIPVYMEEKYPEVPMSVRFPYEDIFNYICDMDPCGRDYLTNSVSYMIAMAIYEGFDEISLYGVDMAVGSEYEKQRPSCEFFIGIAKGLGIKIYIPDRSDLLKTLVVYGRSQKADAFILKLQDRRKFQQAQVKQIDQAIKKNQDEIQGMTASKLQYQGALADVEQTLKVWGNI